MERLNGIPEVFFQEVSKTIGNGVTPERVKNVMRLLREGEYIIHGIKSEEALNEVRKVGILPKTPEGGWVSFWNSGKGIFGSLTLSNKLQTYDSSFFHYASARTVDGGKRLLTVAITNRGLIKNTLGIDIQPGDGYVSIGMPVPRNAFALLTTTKARVKERKDHQALESQLFGLFEVALLEGIKGGEEISRK